jgi:hypothetical protein
LYSRLVQVRRQHDKHAVTYVNATLLCRAEPSRSAASERAAHSGELVSQLRRCFRSILSGGREKGRERAATQVQIAAQWLTGCRALPSVWHGVSITLKRVLPVYHTQAGKGSG